MRSEEYYSKIYLNDPNYNCHYTKSIYYELWKYLMKYLTDYKNTKIYEFGCGVGQFANMLNDEGFKEYIGIDFSQVAIDKAIDLKLKESFNFICGNIINWKIPNGDLILALEVLEHIDDYELLNNQISGTHIIFTVPNFDDPAHLRYFKSTNEVYERYVEHINFNLIDQFYKYYIVNGEIK